MKSDTDRIKAMLTRPLVKHLDQIEPSLTRAEKDEFISLVEEYFGEPVRHRPIRSQVRGLVERIAERLTQGDHR
jgi:hypothetical protein